MNNVISPPLYSTKTKVGFTFAYITIFVISLFGNSVGLQVVMSAKTPSRRITYLLIKNLAVADLILTLTVMPYSVWFMYFDPNRWFGGTMGTITCKLFFYAILVSIAASVITLTIISIDRFFAIYYPLKLTLFHKHKTITMIIWSVSLLAVSPYLLLLQVEKFRDHYVCLLVWPWSKNSIETYHVMRAFHIFGFIAFYALPLLITAVLNCLVARRVWFHKSPGNASSNRASTASRRKVIRMLAIIVVGFALCWLPTYINHYFMFFQPAVWEKIPIAVWTFNFWLSYANSAINPLFYIGLYRRFRKAFLDALTVLFAFPCQVVSHCMSCFTEEPSAAMPSPRNEAPRQQNGGGRYIVGGRENSGRQKGREEGGNEMFGLGRYRWGGNFISFLRLMSWQGMGVQGKWSTLQSPWVSWDFFGRT